ncbi:hypothetical protein GH714_024091 [Hevea brasiliensis]|uniref:very-long-chain 3-oxoacyl-CoA synthase n=1 Tax=Hevea brasiliensis TaxID=3981 RepID=A0A6A6LR27_HEVBR|nr:hypothetical protein GH714_024091 [Hevea brasiliensis]
MIGESRSTFLSALHNSEDSSDICQIGQSDLGLSQNEFASDPNDSELHSPINEVLDDFSLDPDSEAVSVDRNAYDPSLWTPMEMATATGNADSMLLEHPLKLKSTYAGMEDCSGTRDSNGEPLVTSYNRCFLGTVDYIWQIFMERSQLTGSFAEQSLEFQRKILESAGLISIDLAKDLLQVHPNSYALVISMENITLNWYFGNDRSMLLSNCLFRMGGAAIMLSNKRSEGWRSKYRLVHTVRTHKGADDKCFSCVTQREDSTGRIGVSLSKDLMGVAGDALKTNITTLGPLVLPMSEQLLFFTTLVGKKLLKMKIKPYIPDFKLAFEHFCIHAGGRAVLDELEKNLQLSHWHMEPSRMTLYRFGNTSSSSLWYELAYTEAKGRMKRGDRMWQIAFGSGFKCNSAVWKALRTISPAKEKNPWMDEIHHFPVDVPKFSAI